jgi:hypothetical protein
VKKINHGGASESYNSEMEIDHQNRPSLIFRPGGGGGNIHQVSLHKYSPSGVKVFDKKLPMVHRGLLRKDEKENLWVAGHFGAFVPPAYFSVVKVDTAAVTHALIYDSVPNTFPVAFHVKKEYDFYTIANFKDTVEFAGFNCPSSGSRFLIHYGEPEIVSVSENFQNHKHVFFVYPNPSENDFTLKATFKETTPVSIKVFDIRGSLVYNETIAESRGEINKRLAWNAVPGMYFMEMNSGSTKEIIKLIKK